MTLNKEHTYSQSSEAGATTVVYKNKLEADLIEKVEPVLESLGYQLRDLEVQGSGSNMTVRVYVDVSASAQSRKALRPMWALRTA